MSQSMNRRQLPQPAGVPSTRSRMIASASRVLVTKFPTIANAVERGFGDPTERVRDFETARTSRRMSDVKRGNLSQVDQVILNVEEQNDILRQIIDELKRNRGGPSDDSMDLPRRLGIRGRRTPPGRGRFGAAGRARLARMQESRARRETEARARPTAAATDAERPRPRPTPETPRPTPETPRPAPDAQRLEERQIGSRRVVYDSTSYRGTVAAVRFGGSLLLALNALEIAGEVRDLVALRNLNRSDSEQGITEGEFTEEISRLVGTVLAGAAGSIVGAKLGAVLGTAAGGPWGALIGGLLGGIAGGMQGAQAGDLVAALILDEITGSNRFATMMQEIQDRAQAQRVTPASELGAAPETPEESQVFEMMQQEEQRRREVAGIQERYSDPVLEDILVRLGQAREAARGNPRRQNAVTNIQNELRNYLRSRGSRLDPADVARAQRALEGMLSPAVTDLNRPVSQSMVGDESLVDLLSSHEFDEINIQADEIEFDGEVSFSTQQPSATAEYILPIAAPVSNRARPIPTAPQISVPTVEEMESEVTQTYQPPIIEASPSVSAPIPRISAGTQRTARISPQSTAVAPQTPVTPTTPEGGGDFMSQLRAMSSRLGVSAENMLAIMRSESSLNPQAVNPTTGASGLIQFMPRTARSLGTTVEDIRRMSAVEQLPFVERFFRSVGVQPGASAGRLYAYVFLPGRANREVLTERGESFYEANRGLDMDRDGRITIADLDARLARFGGVLAAESGQMAATDQTANRAARTAAVGQASPVGGAGPEPERVEPQRVVRDVPLNRRLEEQAA